MINEHSDTDGRHDSDEPMIHPDCPTCQRVDCMHENAIKAGIPTPEPVKAPEVEASIKMTRRGLEVISIALKDAEGRLAVARQTVISVETDIARYRMVIDAALSGSAPEGWTVK